LVEVVEKVRAVFRQKVPTPEMVVGVEGDAPETVNVNVAQQDVATPDEFSERT